MSRSFFTVTTVLCLLPKHIFSLVFFSSHRIRPKYRSLKWDQRLMGVMSDLYVCVLGLCAGWEEYGMCLLMACCSINGDVTWGNKGKRLWRSYHLMYLCSACSDFYFPSLTLPLCLRHPTYSLCSGLYEGADRGKASDTGFICTDSFLANRFVPRLTCVPPSSCIVLHGFIKESLFSFYLSLSSSVAPRPSGRPLHLPFFSSLVPPLLPNFCQLLSFLMFVP